MEYFISFSYENQNLCELFIVGSDDKVPVTPWFSLVPCLRKPSSHPFSSLAASDAMCTGFFGMPGHVNDYRQHINTPVLSHANTAQHQSLSTVSANTSDMQRVSSHSLSPQYPINYHVVKHPPQSAVTGEKSGSIPYPQVANQVTALTSSATVSSINVSRVITAPAADMTANITKHMKSTPVSIPLPAGNNTELRISCKTRAWIFFMVALEVLDFG